MPEKTRCMADGWLICGGEARRRGGRPWRWGSMEGAEAKRRGEGRAGRVRKTFSTAVTGATTPLRQPTSTLGDVPGQCHPVACVAGVACNLPLNS